MIITTLLFLYNLLTIKITENLHQEDSGNYSCHLPSASLSVTASLQILKGGCFSLTFKIYQTSARIFHQSTEMNIHSKLTFLIFSWTLVRVEAWDSTDSWRSRTSASNQIFSPPSFPFPPLFSLPLPHFSSNYILFLFPKLPAPPLLSLAPFFLLVSLTAQLLWYFPPFEKECIVEIDYQSFFSV